MYRTIVADPGLYLKLPWAHVKSELAPYLKHPEKLRDDDLLECYAQIYEAQRTLPAAQLAALALGDAAFAPQLQPLTQAKAQMLGAPQLFKPTARAVRDASLKPTNLCRPARLSPLAGL